MDILNKNVEIVLSKIINDKIKQVDKSYCEESEVKCLIEGHYIDVLDASTFNGWGYYIESITERGKKYFEEKREFIKQQNRKKLYAIIKFWLPITISLCSLALSIVAIIKC